MGLSDDSNGFSNGKDSNNVKASIELSRERMCGESGSEGEGRFFKERVQ